MRHFIEWWNGANAIAGDKLQASKVSEGVEWRNVLNQRAFVNNECIELRDGGEAWQCPHLPALRDAQVLDGGDLCQPVCMQDRAAAEGNRPETGEFSHLWDCIHLSEDQRQIFKP
eukprot:TRINITY_DN9910_c0_g4_i1.p2 TRINITY_DN9910_c0_g4~~TRINITY_DN9910_c0_g4_i1.p2  ORF type:complete len:115 (-),score=22.98 TRINITY_DN9910_c0_g4_i1:90-434(-)